MGKRLGSVLGLSLCVIGLSACESTSNAWNGTTSTEVVMREDPGATVQAPLTPELHRQNESTMPDGYQVQGGVEILSDFNAMPPMAPVMHSNFETMNVTGDSSVTIFSLDGPAAPIQNYTGGSEFFDPSIQVAAPAYTGGAAPQTQIFFKHGSSRLGSGDMQKISQVAQSAGMASGRISVEGHASRPSQTSDPVRGSILNLKESMNRAYEVSKALIQKGVPASKLKTTAYGDTVPASSEEQHRRVDIISGGY